MKVIIRRVIRYLSSLLFLFSLFAPHAVLAQADGDDAYDPFADYSEFDEASDEEADINFFRNGRFFTIGFAGGLRNFTGNLGKIYGSAPSYGLYMAYFFDLRMALQFSFLTGDHGLEFKDPQETVIGTVSFTLINIDMKYYLSSQNVTRGLADLSPYFQGGIAQVYRTVTIPGDSNSGRDAVTGFNFGGGVEVPIVRKKSYVGFQAMYHYFTFKDENQFIHLPVADVDTKVKPNGDSYDLMMTLGLSF
jgi:hypothetical protein